MPLAHTHCMRLQQTAEPLLTEPHTPCVWQKSNVLHQEAYRTFSGRCSWDPISPLNHALICYQRRRAPMTPACDEPSCPLTMSRRLIPYRFVARAQLRTCFFSSPPGRNIPQASSTIHKSRMRHSQLTMGGRSHETDYRKTPESHLEPRSPASAALRGAVRRAARGELAAADAGARAI